VLAYPGCSGKKAIKWMSLLLTGEQLKVFLGPPMLVFEVNVVRAIEPL